MKDIYITLEDKEKLEIITRFNFNKGDKLKDFLENNKGSKVRIMFV